MILEEFSWKDYKKIVQKSAHDYYQPQIDELKQQLAEKDSLVLQLQAQIEELTHNRP